MADDTTRAVIQQNAKRRVKRPVLEQVGKKLPQLTISDYSAMSPLAIGPKPSRRGKKPTL